MIRVIFKRDSVTSDILSFEMKGHANSGPFGQDIVCAACSALSLNTVNSIIALLDIQPEIKEKSGYLRLDLDDSLSEQQRHDLNLLLESLYLGLTAIEEEYSKFVSIQSIEGGAK